MNKNICTQVTLKSAQPTLRDQFAMAALQGLLAQSAGADPRKLNLGRNETLETICAEGAYKLADAMLEVRDR